mgnify:CR=1 FL=1
MAATAEVQLYCPWCLTPETKDKKKTPCLKVEMTMYLTDHDRSVGNFRYRCPRCKYEELHDSLPSSWPK